VKGTAGWAWVCVFFCCRMVASIRHWVALVAVVECTGGIELSEKSADDAASPYHEELIVFSLL